MSKGYLSSELVKAMQQDQNVLNTILKEGDLVFDIGANLGLKANDYRKFGARVICCEPQPDCVQRLREMFATDSQVEILEIGLGSHIHTAQLSICQQANTISTISDRWKTGRFKNFQWDHTIPIQVMTLDRLISRYGRPKYCKIDVEGYEIEVLKGLTSIIPYVSIEFCKEFIDDAERCIFYLMGLGYRNFNVSYRESNVFGSTQWLSAEELLHNLSQLCDPEEWGDIWASTEITKGTLPFRVKNLQSMRSKDDLMMERLVKISEPLRLHLGCGEKYLAGYVNVDFPPEPERHSVMHTQPDVFADITEMDVAEGTVSEIRLHHVFEHFGRVTALALLIRWHRWLRLGGKLHIETPDLIGSAKTLVSQAPYRTKASVVRHLAGDQAAEWGYHVDHWFPERFEHTLKALGFTEVTTRSWNWEQEPYLSNVEVTAIKSEDRQLEEQLSIADRLLWESTVSDSEIQTHETWRRELRALFGMPCESKFTFQPRKDIACSRAGVSSRFSFSGRGLWNKFWRRRPSATLHALEEFASKLPNELIQNFNQRNRDRWVATKAQSIQAGATVLDVGAGTCRYRKDFSHCNYKTHDFKRYEGYLNDKNDKEGRYGEIDYISDITAIPVPDNSYDVVLCTEVLEHVPEPIAALQEMSRILKPGGRLLITAPLGSGLHQIPYHFYGGFTPYWYRHFCPKYGLSVVEVVPNGGFFKLLAQECTRVAWTMPQHEHLHGNNKEMIRALFEEVLPRFLFELEERCMIEQFTVGYHVEAMKSLIQNKQIS